MKTHASRGTDTLLQLPLPWKEKELETPPRAGKVPGEQPTVTRVGYAPIVRVDPARREIELCATSEAVDAHGTVFAYAASRDAFARWAGNVREMHERKAVGRRVAVRCDDTARKVYVRVRISRGAEDTWQKVLDGTLRGASIGAANVHWRHQPARTGTSEDIPDAIPTAVRYDLVELSLVDLPSNPDALGITLVRTLVRDGVPLADQLDDVDDVVDDGANDGANDDAIDGDDAVDDAPPAHTQDAAPSAHPQEPPVTTRLPRAFTATDAPHPTNPAQAIAASALARGRAQVARDSHPGAEHGTGSGDPEARPGAAKRARLAELGAPGYVAGTVPTRNGPGTDGTVNGREGLPGVHAAVRTPVVYDRERPDHRARGPFSANPDGPPHMGVPARADERPTSLHALHSAHGDSHTYTTSPTTSPATSHSDSHSDRAAAFHTAARTLLHACGCPACHTALAALDADTSNNNAYNDDTTDDDTYPADAGETRAADPFAADLARTLDAHLNTHIRRLSASIAAVHSGVDHLGTRLGALLGTIEQRVAAIEEQPMPGGPYLRVADKTHALQPASGSYGGPYGGSYGSATSEHPHTLEALAALAGRLRDPQAQIAVATEMIRLQQEAAGLPPDTQAMPRAGTGG